MIPDNLDGFKGNEIIYDNIFRAEDLFIYKYTHAHRESRGKYQGNLLAVENWNW